MKWNTGRNVVEEKSTSRHTCINKIEKKTRRKKKKKNNIIRQKKMKQMKWEAKKQHTSRERKRLNETIPYWMWIRDDHSRMSWIYDLNCTCRFDLYTKHTSHRCVLCMLRVHSTIFIRVSIFHLFIYFLCLTDGMYLECVRAHADLCYPFSIFLFLSASDVLLSAILYGVQSHVCSLTRSSKQTIKTIDLLAQFHFNSSMIVRSLFFSFSLVSFRFNEKS